MFTPIDATPIQNSNYASSPEPEDSNSTPSSPRRLVETNELENFCRSIQISTENVNRFCNLLCFSPVLAAGVEELRLGPVYLSLRRLSELLSLFPDLRSLRLRRVIFLTNSSDIRVHSDVLNQLAPHRHLSKRSLDELTLYSCRFESSQTQVHQLISLCAPQKLYVHAPKRFHKSRSSPRRVRPSLEEGSTETGAISRILRLVKMIPNLASSDDDDDSASESTYHGFYIQPSLQQLSLSRVNERFLTLIHDSVKCVTLKDLAVYRAHDGVGRYISDAAWYLTNLRLELDASKFADVSRGIHTAARGVAFCTRLSKLTFRVNLCSERTFVWEYIATIIASCCPSIELISIEITRWEGIFECDSEDARKHGKVVDAAIAKCKDTLSRAEFLWVVEKEEDGPSEEMIEAVEKWLPRTNETDLLNLGIVFAL